MVVTRSGPTGLSALIHVDRELSVALVPVPIPYQRTVDRIVADRVNLRNCKGVTHAAVQVKTLPPVLKRPADFSMQLCPISAKGSHDKASSQIRDNMNHVSIPTCRRVLYPAQIGNFENVDFLGMRKPDNSRGKTEN